MTIKKLQNDFTTPEQSKRLLELGVPADSANMFYFAIGNSQENYIRGIFYETPDVLNHNNIFHELTKNTLPCWSVGRLIEIISICGSIVRVNRFNVDKVADFYRSTEVSVVDLVIDDIENLVKSECMYFSRLTE